MAFVGRQSIAHFLSAQCDDPKARRRPQSRRSRAYKMFVRTIDKAFRAGHARILTEAAHQMRTDRKGDEMRACHATLPCVFAAVQALGAGS